MSPLLPLLRRIKENYSATGCLVNICIETLVTQEGCPFPFWREFYLNLNFPNLEKKIINQVQEVQRVPYRINPRRNTPRHILIKLTKIKHKERILKAAREKQEVTYKASPICLTANLAEETLQARREWQDIFKVLKGKNLQPRLL